MCEGKIMLPKYFSIRYLIYVGVHLSFHANNSISFSRATPKHSDSLPDRDQSIKCCTSNILRKLAPLSFVLCVSWIGVISYLVTWMITIIGFTIGVPDTVMGLSFLAVGTSVPEVFSSLIVCKQGKVMKILKFWLRIRGKYFYVML